MSDTIGEAQLTRSVSFFNYPHVFLSAFEHNLAAFLSVSWALGVGVATDGLHFDVCAAGLGPGDEVLMSSHTMIATAAAVHFAGATPVPVDCGPDHLIDPAAVAAAVNSRTPSCPPN